MRAPDGAVSWWGTPGSEQGRFNFGIGGNVAVSPDGSLIAVGEEGNHRIQLFDRSRNYIASYGRLGDGPGQLKFPSVTIDAQNRIWVVDGFRRDVQQFTVDGWVQTFANEGEHQPADPAMSSFREDTGELYVPDFERKHISVWNEDGTWVRDYESRPEEGLRFSGINKVHVDDAGRMFVVDTTNRIFVLDPDGHLIGTIPSVLPDGIGPVDLPGFALDRQGRLYYADAHHRRLIVLQLLPPIWPPPG